MTTFPRDTEAIRQDFIMATSRMAAARQERDQALARSEAADNDAMRHERNMEYARRTIEQLLDELNAARDAQAAAMVRA